MLHLFMKQIIIGSPVSGKIVSLSDVNDPVFSGKAVGDGCAVVPDENLVCSPCDGRIVQIIDTNHAFCVLSDDGLEILVHIGLDTVKLRGAVFKRLKEEGMRVITGDPIMEVDLRYLRSQNKEIVTPVLITNMDKVDNIKIHRGNIRAADKLMSIVLK
nr:PTS glucose transporter subunit IIA [uncultured Caproiciproducens sp.]